jgi:hypothetical protein
VTTIMTRLFALALLAFSVRCSATTGPTMFGLADARFESAESSKSPVGAWYSEDVATGGLRVSRGSSLKTEGADSCRVDVVRSRNQANGRPSLSQVVGPKGVRPGRYEWSVALRGEASDPVTLEVYVWDNGVVRRLATEDVLVTSSFTRSSLQFDVPPGYDRFGVFVFVPASNGARFWIDDARLTMVSG